MNRRNFILLSAIFFLGILTYKLIPKEDAVLNKMKISSKRDDTLTALINVLFPRDDDFMGGEFYNVSEFIEYLSSNYFDEKQKKLYGVGLNYFRKKKFAKLDFPAQIHLLQKTTSASKELIEIQEFINLLQDNIFDALWYDLESNGDMAIHQPLFKYHQPISTAIHPFGYYDENLPAISY